MRKKALLVGAASPFIGPRVNLEEGEWLVEPPALGEVELRIEGLGDLKVHEAIKVSGPCTVQGIARNGASIHLDIKQVRMCA